MWYLQLRPRHRAALLTVGIPYASMPNRAIRFLNIRCRNCIIRPLLPADSLVYAEAISARPCSAAIWLDSAGNTLHLNINILL
ncbi:MAG: hypothetical protein IBX58_05015 [Roseovarius sp.]|nr:hypothetical protein [Roseovarius sp.]